MIPLGFTRKSRKMLMREPAIMRAFESVDGMTEIRECSCGWEFRTDRRSRLMANDQAAIHLYFCRGTKPRLK